jgi:hypothetical protein
MCARLEAFMAKWPLLVVLTTALALGGCASATDDSADDAASETDQMLKAGRKLSEGQVADALRTAGFDEDEVPRMVCTAKYESDFYERASNSHNRNGTIDRGLFQINSVHLGRAGCPRTGEGLYTASANAKCALVIWRSQGNNAWYGYKKHRAECDSYVVDE